MSVAEFIGVTIHFPWIINDEIPLYRLHTLRIAILLTFAHYGVLHLFGKNQEYLPIHFLNQFLFYLVMSGAIIFYKNELPVWEYWILVLFTIVWLLTVIAAKPLIRDYFKNK
ncbi:hypothetical protein N9P08_00960 [Alphaproteobacteria bacterium]|nr:hypothetical protein [Alphaproteobacteria bacterium]